MPEHWLENWLLRAFRAAVGPAPIRLVVSGIQEQYDASLCLPEIRIADCRTAAMP